MEKRFIEDKNLFFSDNPSSPPLTLRGGMVFGVDSPPLDKGGMGGLPSFNNNLHLIYITRDSR
jgi:hypothetical protein